jgi:hypothetical protein
VHRCDRDEHVDGDAEGCDSFEEAENQLQSVKELSRDGQERERDWNVRRACALPHVSRESVPAEPTQHLLGAVREKDNPEYQPENDRSRVVVRDEQFT